MLPVLRARRSPPATTKMVVGRAREAGRSSGFKMGYGALSVPVTKKSTKLPNSRANSAPQTDRLLGDQAEVVLARSYERTRVFLNATSAVSSGGGKLAPLRIRTASCGAFDPCFRNALRSNSPLPPTPGVEPRRRRVRGFDRAATEVPAP